MLFAGKLLLPLRLRLLLALIAAAGAGVFLTYSGIKNAAGVFVMEETGGKLFLRLSLAGEAVEKEINSGLEAARAIAGRASLREPLSRLGQGFGQPGDREELKARLGEAAAASASIAALQLAGANGSVAASYVKAAGTRSFAPRSRLSRRPGGAYAGLPYAGAAALEYEVSVPVPVAAEKGLPARLGELRCLFNGRPLPASLRESGLVSFTLAERRGKSLKIAEAGGSREISIASEQAVPFLSALEGKEGYSVIKGAGGKTLYAYRRLNSSDWILTAATPYSAAARRGEDMLAAARLYALLSFAFLSIAAFFAAGLVLRPVTENARTAGAFLEECGQTAQEAAPGPDTDIIDKALAEASQLAKNRGRNGAELETETEKLRVEDADLKSQNTELEKLNQYLLDREIKISDLKKEISELKEKFTREPAE